MRYWIDNESEELYVSYDDISAKEKPYEFKELTKEEYRKISSKRIIDGMLKKYGEDTQIDVAIEEMSELIKELIKYKRAKVYKSENNPRRQYVLEEMGDVLFMIEYLKIIFNITEDDINDIIIEKSTRTGERYL